MELQELREQLDHKVLLELPVAKDPKGSRDPKEFKATPVPKERQELPALRGQLAPQVLLERQACKVQPDQVELQDHKVVLALLVLRDHKVFKVTQVPKVLQEQPQPYLGLLVRQARVERQELRAGRGLWISRRKSNTLTTRPRGQHARRPIQSFGWAVMKPRHHQRQRLARIFG